MTSIGIDLNIVLVQLIQPKRKSYIDKSAPKLLNHISSHPSTLNWVSSQVCSGPWIAFKVVNKTIYDVIVDSDQIEEK